MVEVWNYMTGMGALIALNECVCSHNGPLDVLAYISFYTDNMEIEFPVLEQHIPWFPQVQFSIL